MNQDFIAKTICVKKELKKNTCQGKCHLKKQLDKLNKEEKKQAPSAAKDKYEVLYSHLVIPFNFLKYPEIYLSKLNSAYNNSFHTISFITDIFRPPKLNLIL